MARPSPRWFAPLAALAAAALGLAHCSGGQSGHEGLIGDLPGDTLDAGFDNCGRFGNCPGQPSTLPPCACQDFVGRIALFGVLAADRDGTVEVAVRELAGGPGCERAQGSAEAKAGARDAGTGCALVPGDVLRARWNGQLPCAQACADIPVGERVLALYDPQRGEVALTRAQDPELGDKLDLGAGRVFDEEASLLVAGGAECEAAVENASGARIAHTEDAQTQDASDRPAQPGDAGSEAVCPRDDSAIDAGPPPRTGPPFLGHPDACAEVLAGAPIDCLDVCGALTTCDPQVACDECLQRCVASGESRQGYRCLSHAIYAIDEEGCSRMVPEYLAFSDAYDCP